MCDREWYDKVTNETCSEGVTKMTITKEGLKGMLSRAAELWIENRDYLSEIDSRFGDGDHGVTIGKIAGIIKKDLEEWDGVSMYDFLDDLGMDIMAVSGGSAGPLYGTMIGGLAGPLENADEIDGELLKAMFAASLESMEDITKAKVGDKTMMDALIPAVEAAKAAGDDVHEILEAAKEAAKKGAKESEQYVSKFGRARSYKEETIGTPDAGAVSTSLFFEGICGGLSA